uniref:Unique cartilage matrix-associated protein n=1 Tax=Varanus komodoensis TaxID=61221 RepID=A0A8D2LDP0_VARKO
MKWKQGLFLSCLTTFVLLIGIKKLQSYLNIVYKSDQLISPLLGMKNRVFMQESDASNFFKKRGKRSTKTRDELNAETRQMLAADEQRREYHEEQRNEFENFVEEEHDEQDERSREQIEQWRQYHYDGLYPSYLYNRHTV